MIFWVRDDPGDPLGRRVPPVLSHLGSVGTARLLGWSFGGLLRSCPPKPMFLVCEAIPRLPCVALVSGTVLLVRGVLPRSGRRRPVTLAGVMKWCEEANHHYSGGRQRLWTPPPVVSRGPRERRCPLVRESCWLISCRKIRRAGVLGPARGLSWLAHLSGGAAFLERTSWVMGTALTQGIRSGGCHVSRGAGLPDSLPYKRRQLPAPVGGPSRFMARRACWAPDRTSLAR